MDNPIQLQPVHLSNTYGNTGLPPLSDPDNLRAIGVYPYQNSSRTEAQYTPMYSPKNRSCLANILCKSLYVLIPAGIALGIAAATGAFSKGYESR